MLGPLLVGSKNSWNVQFMTMREYWAKQCELKEKLLHYLYLVRFCANTVSWVGLN